jgi:uncharacterized SAM-binding protein YcdF (DUF218 family)
VLVCGGQVNPATSLPPVAAVMATFLREQGVSGADLLLEDRSRSTYENAVEAQRLLKERGVRRIVLVTEAYHMPRAERCFRNLGLEVTPSPCSHQAARFHPDLFTFLPDPYTPMICWLVTHEWIGMAWYRLRGWI